MANGHGDKLSRRQEQAIAALLAEPTVEAAARAAGVCHRTLKRWLTLPDFAAAYAAARRQVLEGSVAQLLASTGLAVQALRDALDASRAADRIRAAVAILVQCNRGVELLDLESRVAALEARHKLRRQQ
jgi:hypothetical protein